MSVAGPSQDANSAPCGGSAAATAASVGVVIRAAGLSQDANSAPLWGQRSGDSRKRGGPLNALDASRRRALDYEAKLAARFARGEQALRCPEWRGCP